MSTRIKPLEDVRPETEEEEFNRLYPEGSEVRRVKEVELRAAGVSIPGETVPNFSLMDVDQAEFAAFRAWRAGQAANKDATPEEASTGETPAWRS